LWLPSGRTHGLVIDMSIIVDEKIGKAIKKWLKKKEEKEQAVQTWVVHVKNESNFLTRES